MNNIYTIKKNRILDKFLQLRIYNQIKIYINNNYLQYFFKNDLY